MNGASSCRPRPRCARLRLRCGSRGCSPLPSAAARCRPSAGSWASRRARAAPCWRCGSASACRRSGRSAWLPARLGHAGDDALVGELPQADSTETELAVGRASAAAAVAAQVRAGLEALGLLRLLGKSLACNSLRLSFVVGLGPGERHPERAQQREPLLVRLGGGGDRDVEAANDGDRVVVGLREDDLLADPEREVAAAVHRARVQPAEVADARERDRDKAVEELPHAGAAQRYARADGHALAELEAGDRPACEAHLRALTGDRGQLLDRAVELLRVGLRLADAHVERDLLQPRDLHRRGEAQLVLQARPDLLLVGRLQPRLMTVGAHLSITCPQSARLQTRTGTSRPWTCLVVIPIRVGRLHVGQTSITLATGTGAAFAITPPGVICVPPMRFASRIGRGRVWRFWMFRFSTMTRCSRGRASITRPSLPRSLPESMWTTSPLRMRILWLTGPPGRARRSS